MHSILSWPATSPVGSSLSQRIAKCGVVLALLGFSAVTPSGIAVAGAVPISTGTTDATPACSPTELSAAPLQGTAEALVPAPQVVLSGSSI